MAKCSSCHEEIVRNLCECPTIVYEMRQRIEQLEAEVQKAVLAERDRCALIVESGHCECYPPGCYESVCAFNFMEKKIRAGI